MHSRNCLCHTAPNSITKNDHYGDQLTIFKETVIEIPYPAIHVKRLSKTPIIPVRVARNPTEIRMEHYKSANLYLPLIN
jgi:hypothetical protein